jgi:tetratricopeptide (TPR) repeat protein
MDFNQSEESQSFSLTRFESMLKTNNIFFFDSSEFENIIHHYLEIGKIALAKKAIKLGLDQHPSSVNLRLFDIEVLIFENKLNQAEKLLNNLFKFEPNNEELYIQKANIFSKRDNHKQAIKVFKEALNISEDSSELHSLIGMEYLFLDNYENAKIHFMKCIDLDLEDYSSLYNIIYCFEFLDQTEKAIEYLTWYLDQNPYCEVAWHQLGKQYLEINVLEKALTAFDFAIISDDTFIGAYFEKAKVLEKLGRYGESIDQYKLSIAIEGPTAFSYLKIGCCYSKLNNNDEFLKYLFKSVKEDPAFDRGWIEIAKFYFTTKDNLKALFYVNKAIDIDEQNPKYWLFYSKINKRLNYYEEAERGFKRTLEYGDNSVEIWIERGDILIQLGEIEAARINFKQALDQHPKNEEIEYRISGIYFELNNFKNGFKYLLIALHRNPEHVFILEELFPNVYRNKKIIQFIKDYNSSSR